MADETTKRIRWPTVSEGVLVTVISVGIIGLGNTYNMARDNNAAIQAHETLDNLREAEVRRALEHINADCERFRIALSENTKAAIRYESLCRPPFQTK